MIYNISEISKLSMGSLVKFEIVVTGLPDITLLIKYI